MSFSIMAIIAGALLTGIFMTGTGMAGEIGFIEDYSLARDRKVALEQLIPGTGDYYYYNCLEAQHHKDFDKVRQLLSVWIGRHGHTQRVKEIMNRQALLEYKQTPEKTLQYIKKELGLSFRHYQDADTQTHHYPSILNSKPISIAELTALAFKAHKNLDGFEDYGLELLDHDQLNPVRLRDLLKRLTFPDIPNLANLVVRDLKTKNSSGFGSLNIHNRLLTKQLIECADLMPQLMDDTTYINARLIRLRPGNDIDLRYAPDEKTAYLKRMYGFVNKLSSGFNTLKTHILYHFLDAERSRGHYDKNNFRSYLKLPRQTDYIKAKSGYHLADLHADFNNVSGMPPIGNDEELVRDYLFQLLSSARDYKEYLPYINDNYLKTIFAQVKIMAAQGDAEALFSMLSPSEVQELKERIDLQFAPSNPEFFDTDQLVVLKLYLKNVETLVIRIFEINTFNYYQTNLEEVSAAIDLDGLAPTRERLVKYTDPPQHRILRTFEFKKLQDPGVYVIDFIGNGKSSRAVIRKGRLYATETIGPAGHEFVIYDDQNHSRPDAAIFLAGRKYTPDKNNDIIIPFTDKPGQRSIILKDKDFCSLEKFEHQAENYQLHAGFYTPRENLIKGHKARVILRTQLSLNGFQISPGLLENPQMTIASTDSRGVTSIKEILDLEISEKQEAVHKFQIPSDLVHLKFSLSAKIQNMSQNKKQTLTDTREFSFNQMNATDTTADLFLSRDAQDYQLYKLGKNGEPRAGNKVHLTVKHCFFRTPHSFILQTATDGSINLGTLPQIEWIRAQSGDQIDHTFQIDRRPYHYPQYLHGHAQTELRLPYFDDYKVSLFEKRGHTFNAQHPRSLSINNNWLHIKNLTPGDYTLCIKPRNIVINLRITGTDNPSVINDQPFQITEVETTDTEIRVKLSHAGEYVRLHVIGSCFMPFFDLRTHLTPHSRPNPYTRQIFSPLTQYIDERRLGDEYRYILERRFADKYPGNMLARPELLLNPWELQSTQTDRDDAKAGESFRGAPPPSPQAMRKLDHKTSSSSSSDGFSVLDFLSQGAVMLTNLKPDQAGVVHIPLAKLGYNRHIQLLALDPLYAVYQEVNLGSQKIKTRDLTMTTDLDPQVHFGEIKTISKIKTSEIKDLGEYEVYADLKSAGHLLETLSHNKIFHAFNFILKWPDLTLEEKCRYYSKYTCHELNFFLFHKDPYFFKTVVKPHLQNKPVTTFMDDWLLGNNLKPYTRAWEFSQLNVVEKILLAQGLPQEAITIKKHLDDLFELLPDDQNAQDYIFDTALRQHALEPSSAGKPMGKIEGVSPALSMAKELNFQSMLVDAEFDEAEVRKPEKQNLTKSRKKGFKFKQRKNERKSIHQFFQKLDQTKEWVENNYYHLTVEQQNNELIKLNQFWQDYSHHNATQPFLSTHFGEAHHNFTEIMLALAVLDLPFKKVLKPETNVIIFHKQLKIIPNHDDIRPLMLSQDYFLPHDRFEYNGKERRQKFVRDEFIQHQPIGCLLTVSNPSNQRCRLNLLKQIPAGSLPLQNGFYTHSQTLKLEPFTSQQIEYYFYFPGPGSFEHYPLHITEKIRGKTVNAGFSAPFKFKVVQKLSRVDTHSWQYISQYGTTQEVLKFLETHNLKRIELTKIAFRMKDASFFKSVLKVLSKHKIYQTTLWSYGIYHHIPDRIKEFLEHSDLVSRCGLVLNSPLLNIDPQKRNTYQHKEYKPLVNARIHQPLGRKILNDRFFDQYQNFLKLISYKPILDDRDKIETVYYLLLQERITEAEYFFKKIKSQDSIQYAYLQVYMHFYHHQLDQARRIATTYLNYPVPHWADFFKTAIQQLDQIKGKTQLSQNDQNQDRNQLHDKMARTEPSFEFRMEGTTIKLTYQNLKTCQVNYYPMNIELLFSRNPFMRKQPTAAAFIRPRHSDIITLPAKTLAYEFKIPEEFCGNNLIIEITSPGRRQAKVYNNSSMLVRLSPNYGLISTSNGKQPLSGTYIKVYARMHNQSIKFYKDGYTDLRGSFDYVSLNTNELDQVEQFAILALHPNQGAVIQETEPPMR